MNWMTRNGCSHFGKGAETHAVVHALPHNTLRSPTAREPLLGGQICRVSGIKVRKSAEFVNVNSRNTCRTYSIEISATGAHLALNRSGSPEATRVLGITAPWYDSAILPTIGTTRFTALSCHVPLRMPHGGETRV
jgi:hypothetical protein